MPNTPRLALPYPAPSVTPDVPYWMQQLAEAVEGKAVNLPAPVRTQYVGPYTTLGTVNTYVDASATIGSAAITLPRPCLVALTMAAWMRVAGSANCEIFFKLVSSGAHVVDTETAYTAAGALDLWTESTEAAQHHQSTTIFLVLPTGTTTFKPWVKRSTAVTTAEYKNVNMHVVPIQWADNYVVGAA